MLQPGTLDLYNNGVQEKGPVSKKEYVIGWGSLAMVTGFKQARS